MVKNLGLVVCSYAGCMTLLAGKRSPNFLCMKHEQLLFEISKSKSHVFPIPQPRPLLPAPKPKPETHAPPSPSSGGTPVADVRKGGRIRRGHRQLIEDLKRKIAGRARDEAEPEVPTETL